MTATPDPTSMLITARHAAAREGQPKRDLLCVEVALRIVANVAVEDGPGLTLFVSRYLKGWEADAAGINEARSVLRNTIAKRAIRCVIEELPIRGEG